jgi:tRNA (mo5U34)-methyltransferase
MAGLEVAVGIDAKRLESIRRNPAYRGLVRPAVRFLRSRSGSADATDGGKPFQPARPVAALEDPEAAAIWNRIADIGWYHTIDLGHGIATPGFIDNRSTAHLFGIPTDLTGKRCLDIGTYDGFWCFEMERRGASEVIGIDVDSPDEYDLPRILAQRAAALEADGTGTPQERWSRQMAPVGLQWPGKGFRTAAEILGSRARREHLNVYDLGPDKLGQFDVVLISQLLLRLRDPATVLENMASVTKPGGCAIVAEGYDPDLEALSKPVSEFVGTSSMGIWWAHSIKSMRKIMETAGFERIEEVSRFPAENRVGSFAKVVLRGFIPSL